MSSETRTQSFIKARINPARISYILLAFWLCSCRLLSQEHNMALEKESNIHLADPTVFHHEGTYYLYGTVEGNTDKGFVVYTSKNMKTWDGPKGMSNGLALKQEDVFGTKGFWAPQVFHYQNRFYMAYTANERIAIAESNSPLGPFTQQVKEPLAAPIKQIDPFVYIDDDEKKYLYHVRLNEGNRIFVAEMTDELSGIKEETLRECIAAKEPWENTSSAEWPVAEGPTVLKYNGLYYMIYSANDFRNPDYAVGYAISRSPLGPWVKQTDSPIISTKNIGKKGTGHGDFVRDKKENLVYVFHTHQSDTTVAPRKTAIVKARFSRGQGGETKLTINPNSFFYPSTRQ